MAATHQMEPTHSLLPSMKRILEVVSNNGAGAAFKLRRLVSIVVADFPRALFKLQVVDPESKIRVVPEFVTPLLQSIVDRYRTTLGPVDVRDASVAADADSLIEAGIVSQEPIRIVDQSEITRYFAAHFTHTDRDLLATVIREDLGIREVLLIPVRPHELPFGVVSVSSASRLGEAEVVYWRSVARAVEGIYRHSQRAMIDSLRRLALARSQTPTILVDREGEPIDVNRAATALLGFREHAATMRHLGNLRPCLPARDELSSGHDDGSVFYLTDAHGAEVACTIHTETLTDDEGQTLGAVIELQVSEDLKTRSIRLTRRQREVARLIAVGRTTKEVAYELGLSVHTVNYHRAQIREQFAGETPSGDLQSKVRRYFLGRR